MKNQNMTKIKKMVSSLIKSLTINRREIINQMIKGKSGKRKTENQTNFQVKMKMAKGYSQEKVERETTDMMELQKRDIMLQKKSEEK